MAKMLPRLPVCSGEKLQYMTHTMNDSSIRFVLHYPGQVDISLLRRAMRHLVDSVFVLRSSFVPADNPYWQVNDGYTAADTVKHVVLAPGAEVLEAAEAEALTPVRFEDTLQLYCVLVENGRESALTLVVSHLIADGGDAKYILLKLAELYNCLLAGAEPDTVPIKNGDRDLLQAFDHVDPEVLDNKVDAAAESGLKSRTEFPFPEPEEVGTKRILRHTIAPEVLKEARKKAKDQGATVNDLLLSAYYRATAELLGMDQTAPLSIMSMLDLRQYMEGGQSQGICNLSSALPTGLPEGVGETFAGTLSRIAQQTLAIKGNGLAGLHNIELGRRVIKGVFSLPFRVLAFAGKVGTRNMPMGMTNLGNVKSSDLALGDSRPDFGCFAGQIKKKPGIQLAVMSLDDVATLTISNICGEEDAAMLHRLMALLEEQLVRYIQEV